MCIYIIKKIYKYIHYDLFAEKCGTPQTHIYCRYDFSSISSTSLPSSQKIKESSVYNVVSKSKFSTRCAKTRYKWSYKATIFFHSENQWSVKAPTYYNMGFLGPHLGPSQPPAPLRHCRRFTEGVAPSAVDLPDNAWHVAARPWEGWEV